MPRRSSSSPSTRARTGSTPTRRSITTVWSERSPAVHSRTRSLILLTSRRSPMSPRIALLLVVIVLLSSRSAMAQPTREVTYNPRSVVRIDARLRMTTLIILPDNEEILDFVCGDKDYWIVSGAQNLAYVKPAKSGATTNLNLVTASGSVYSFLLTEGAGEPDLKLYVAPDDTVKAPADGSKKFYPAEEVAE